jgi:putative colanic acid biosynthesis acetyltransferase WcaF
MNRFLSRAVNLIEYWVVLLFGRLLGISWVIRYLRNPNPSITRRLLTAFGATVGTNVTLKRSIFLDNVYGDANSTGDFSHLKIGDSCYIGDCVFFDLANEIVIADGAVLAGRVSLITHAECKRSVFLSQHFPRMCAPIVIGAGAWIGFGATVLAGVTIGENSVVGADALLMQDTDPHWVYVGSPARKVKRVDDRMNYLTTVRK